MTFGNGPNKRHKSSPSGVKRAEKPRKVPSPKAKGGSRKDAAMKTNDELCRAIAERLGWTEQEFLDAKHFGRADWPTSLDAAWELCRENWPKGSDGISVSDLKTMGVWMDAPQAARAWMWHNEYAGWYPWVWGASRKLCGERAGRCASNGRAFRVTISLAKPAKKAKKARRA